MNNREIRPYGDVHEELEALARSDMRIFRTASVLLALLFVISAVLGISLASKSAELMPEQEVH